MRVAMHQPHYLPWLGYLDKIDRCDLFIFLDHVQFGRNNWQNRNYVKSPTGPVLLTVPVLQNSMDERVVEKVIDDRKPWRRKHRRTIEHCYHGTPFWSEFSEEVLGLYDEPWSALADLAIESVTMLTHRLGIATPWFRSTALGATSGKKTAMIADLCEAVGATTFVSGDTARDYLDVGLLSERGISVEWQSFVHPEYRQAHPRVGFLPRMAAIDLLLNEGPKGFAAVRAARAAAAGAVGQVGRGRGATV